MSTVVDRACNSLRGSLYAVAIVLAAASSLGAALVIPPPQHGRPPQNNTLTTRGECKDKGICPPGTFWSSIEGTEAGMATCCPEGTKAECSPADGLPNLITFFCCSADAQDSPCAASERSLPSVPETCPCGSHIVGAQCIGGSLPHANAATHENGRSAVWPLLGSLVLTGLF